MSYIVPVILIHRQHSKCAVKLATYICFLLTIVKHNRINQETYCDVVLVKRRQQCLAFLCTVIFDSLKSPAFPKEIQITFCCRTFWNIILNYIPNHSVFDHFGTKNISYGIAFGRTDCSYCHTIDLSVLYTMLILAL